MPWSTEKLKKRENVDKESWYFLSEDQTKSGDKLEQDISEAFKNKM